MNSAPPLPLETVFREMQFAEPAGSPSAALNIVRTNTQIVEEFRPLSESLEWRLAAAYWEQAGVQPFVDNSVPHLINNNGSASERAAAVLLAACIDGGVEDAPVTVIELGAGCGLFARFFLDAFKSLCTARDLPYYHNLTYAVTDGARRTVQEWQDRGLFAGHADRTLLATCDARHPDSLAGLDGQAISLRPPTMLVCNYVLDVLPVAVVRTGAAGPEQLCVRTHVSADAGGTGHCALSAMNGTLAAASSTDGAALARLLPLAAALEFETAWRPLDGPALPHLSEALAVGRGAGRVLLNHGALDALDRWLEHLPANGCILIRDYGPASTDELTQHAAPQRFGGSTAVGLNFPLIENHVRSRGWRVVAPGDDSRRSIHIRLVCRDENSRTAAAFLDCFDRDAEELVNAPLAAAQDHVRAGRLQDALACFKEAVERSPRNWFVVGSAAEFVGLQLRDFAAGAELARAALELNPCYSTWLWNVLGDVLYCAGRFDGAHAAYEQALRIDGNDVRTNLNLAYTCLQRGQIERALHAVGHGLVHDQEAAYRDRLLEKQLQILSALSARRQAERERLAKRALAFQSA